MRNDENMKREEDALDLKIRGALALGAERFEQMAEADVYEEGRLRQKVRKRMEETGMKRWNFRKVCVLAGAMCILGSAAVLAAGQFVGFTSHSWATDEITDYGELASVGEQIPFEIKAPESFDNGFAFKNARPVSVSGVDEAGNETELPMEISITYGKEGMEDVSLDQAKARPGVSEHTEEPAHVEGETAYYYKQEQYLFVPPSYELTEEEKKAEEAGELHVGYGSEEAERRLFSSVTWEAGNVQYLLHAFDTSLTEAEMLQMAVQVMEEN